MAGESLQIAQQIDDQTFLIQVQGHRAGKGLTQIAQAVPILDAAQGREHVTQAVEGAHILLGEQQLVNGHVGAHGQAVGAGVANHVDRRSRGQVTEVHPRARPLDEQELPGDSDGLGDIRNPR